MLKGLLWRVLLTVILLGFVVACITPPTPTPTTTPLPTPTVSPLALPSAFVKSFPVIQIKEDIVMDFSQMLMVAVFLSVVANRLIEALVVPLFDKYELDKFPIQYISWFVAAVLVGLSGVNLFSAYLPDPMVGLVLTAIVCGGGANFINDLFDGVLA